MTEPSGTLYRLLELEPELGQLLSDERLERARHELGVHVRRLGVGEWDGERLAGADPHHIGLLVLDGVVAREVVIADNVCAELTGPGDVIRPWHLEPPDRLLRMVVRWNVLAPARVALLDKRLATMLPRYPEVNAVLLDRLNERAGRLGTMQAISQLNRVDRRLLAFFWHVAERWGRIVSDGVMVPLALSHSMLGRLVGARRPTVSTALGELADRGELVRREDGTWLLTGEPVGVPLPEATAVIRQRRRLLPRTPEAGLAEPAAVGAQEAVAAIPDGHADRLGEMHTVLAHLRDSCSAQAQELEELSAQTRALVARAVELRDARRRAGRPSAGSGNVHLTRH